MSEQGDTMKQAYKEMNFNKIKTFKDDQSTYKTTHQR